MSILEQRTFMAAARLLLVLLSLVLSGCASESLTFNLFGKDNSCYRTGSVKSCTKFKLYDSVKLSVNLEKQSVSFVQTAYKLDDSNIVFRTLQECKVIDGENFSCPGLSRANGKFTDTSIFPDLITSESFVASMVARSNIPLESSTLKFIEEYSRLLTLGISLLALFGLIGLAS